MIDKRLIHIINNGRCFVLVGSGLSCEVGYPSWKKLAEQVYKELQKTGKVTDNQSYEKYLAENKYPELFRLAQADLGNDRTVLIDLIKPMLQLSTKNHGVLYEIISKWPFACYLTTNFDDELYLYLSKQKEHFTVKRNRQEDFYYVRDGADHIIQKLHSDLDHPDEAILTSIDYNRFYTDDSGCYFRDKLRQAFETFDFFIIGHSLKDPDIDYVLRLAKKTASPQHPIYMAVADSTKAEEQEFLEKYNIVLVQYSNIDGTHSKLRQILKGADKFIVPRHRLRERPVIIARPKEETEAAISLFLYRRLQGADSTDYLCPLILAGLLSADNGLPKEKITSMPALKIFSKWKINFLDITNKAIDQLLQKDLVTDVSGRINITTNGREIVRVYQSARETEKDLAYGQFRLNLKSNYETLTDSQANQCQNLAEKAIVSSFANRGLAISNQIYSGHSAGPGELSDIFGYVSDIAVELGVIELRAAFVDAMHQFLIEPNPQQRKYLASVSQGYFLYHSLGLDPTCGQIRQDIFQRTFQKTFWICDSSIIIPLIAVGCLNHEYAVELFKMLAERNALIFTTPKLLQEAWDHFDWALKFIEKTGGRSLEFLCAALVKGEYKQNLFLDGYIQLSADGIIGLFEDYLDIVLKNKEITMSVFYETIMSKGIRLVKISDLNGFVQDDWGEIEEIKPNIQRKREERGIYRSPLQVESEAEVFVIIKNFREKKYSISGMDSPEKIYFISQSQLIDQVFQQKMSTTWTPEALYRYLSTLPGSEINADLLQQCMLHEYYYAGVSFINKDRYIKFFGPSIDAAKLSFEVERERYISEVEEIYTKNIGEAFAKTPDLEKPFFVAQMGWRMAERAKEQEGIAKERAVEAEAKVRKLESERGKAWKVRDQETKEQEKAELRNSKDPKHLRKRKKQAKKRKKKK
jgi:hypothetical protein